MSQQQLLLLLILAATVGVFLWGRWRHDVVALAALLAAVFAGLVPATEAFSGFGHPAVITVACVLILSAGLQATGAVDALVQRLLPSSAGFMLTMVILTGLGAVLSAFMNNVGAMALLMPVGIQFASRLEIPPGRVLMPLAFATILGGMTTLIGTPPNLIVSGFRAEQGLESFGMFAFTPVGASVAGAGLLFLALLGWRLVPEREQQSSDRFDAGKYLTEVRVREKGKAVGKSIHEVDEALEDADAQIIALVRDDLRLSAPNRRRLVKAGDILVIEADPESLASALSRLGLVLEEQVASTSDEAGEDGKDDHDGEEGEEGEDSSQRPDKDGAGKGDEVAASGSANKAGRQRSSSSSDNETSIRELVVMAHSWLIDRSASDLNLRTRYGLNLLAISRQGRASIKRLRTTQVKAGDVLLMEGTPEALAGFASTFDCIPLAARSISIPDRRKAVTGSLVMVVAIIGAAFGLLPAAISFASAVLLFVLLRVMPLRAIYESIDWTVIVLLGALIPVALAMQSSGTADLMARALLDTLAQEQGVIALALILIITMSLSDFMNNAATAAVMCPIAVSTAGQLGASVDAFLMAVAVGASCAFLTPIGHQNNTLILGPGGFRFGDYWRLGLPMEIIVIAVALPMLLIVWPL